jgi:hypothetical protein
MISVFYVLQKGFLRGAGQILNLQICKSVESVFAFVQTWALGNAKSETTSVFSRQRRVSPLSA